MLGKDKDLADEMSFSDEFPKFIEQCEKLISSNLSSLQQYMIKNSKIPQSLNFEEFYEKLPAYGRSQWHLN